MNQSRCQDRRSKTGLCGFKYSLISDDKFNYPKCTRSLFLRVAFTTFKVFTVIFIVIFVVFPLIFKYSYKLQNSVVFLNFLHAPSNADYKHPHKYGLEGSRNFYLLTDDNIKIGVWQILPESLNHSSNETDEQYFEDILGDGQNVILYHHGNAGTRLTPHRVELYKVLRKHFHVIAFDYRSYGDSSDVEPSELALVYDCMFMYKWVANRTKGHLFIWAHSLGTSVATRSLALLQQNGYRRPTGFILEAPFNNMREEISEFPMARLFRHLPWFSYTVIEPMQENGFTFRTDKYICSVDTPMIILHAKDDHVVPYKLGYKLYQQALKCRKETQGKLLFYKFDGKHNYDHKYIYKAPEIDDIISDFISTAIKESKEKELISL